MLIERSNNSKNMRLFDELLMLIYFVLVAAINSMPCHQWNIIQHIFTYISQKKLCLYANNCMCVVVVSLLFLCCMFYRFIYAHNKVFFSSFYSGILHSQKNKQQKKGKATYIYKLFT